MEFIVPAAGIGPALAAIAGWPAPGFAARFLRLAGLRPNSRSSQRRMVSRPISMPSSRSPDARVSGESPAWCRRSSSSRCDVSCAVAWLRGCRTCSTAWAKVVGRGGVSEEYAGSDMGADGEWYEQRAVSASGAVGSWSKRKRLDVGVLPHFFVLFLLGESGFFLGSFVGWFIELVDFLIFVSGVFVGLVPLSRWLHRFVGRFSCRFVLGSLDPSLVAGGGGC